jgi:hypothetical protein
MYCLNICETNFKYHKHYLHKIKSTFLLLVKYYSLMVKVFFVYLQVLALIYAQLILLVANNEVAKKFGENFPRQTWALKTLRLAKQAMDTVATPLNMFYKNKNNKSFFSSFPFNYIHSQVIHIFSKSINISPMVDVMTNRVLPGIRKT